MCLKTSEGRGQGLRGAGWPVRTRNESLQFALCCAEAIMLHSLGSGLVLFRVSRFI